MRFLLSSDWRLGRASHGLDLSAEHARALQQLVARAEARRPDALLLAGGLFVETPGESPDETPDETPDGTLEASGAGPSPRHEAEEVLLDLLARVALELSVPTLVLGADPGRAERRGLGARLVARLGLHLIGAEWDPAVPIVLRDEHGPVHVHAAAAAHESARAGFPALVERARSGLEPGARSILLARVESAAEQEALTTRRLKGFACAALGGSVEHLELARGRTIFAGSPVAAGFGGGPEAPSLAEIEIDAKGRCRVERLALDAERRFASLAGPLAELLGREASEDWMRIEVHDEGLVPDLGALRERFPGLLELERPAPRFLPGSAREEVLQRLFEGFALQATGEGLSAEDRALIAERGPE